MEHEIDLLMNSITRVFEKHTGKEYDSKLLTAKKTSKQYSNTTIPVYTLLFNNVTLKNKNHIAVEYRCITCQTPTTVALGNFKRKLNKDLKKCIHCQFGEQENHLSNQACISTIEKIKNAQLEFENEDDDFKHMYFRKHLTKDDFERIKKTIVSIQNGIISQQDFTKLEYYPITRVYNQTKYLPCMYDAEKDTFVKLNFITYKCELCESKFINKDLFIQKNKFKILCEDCNFCNDTITVKTTKNAFDESLTYKSKCELKFINYCNKNRIRVINGPKITYNWNNQEKTFKINFYIPDLGHLVELNDNHEFKKNIKCEKWKVKEEAAKNYCQHNNFTFKLIHTKNYTKECSYISKELSKKLSQLN